MIPAKRKINILDGATRDARVKTKKTITKFRLDDINQGYSQKRL